MILRAIYDGDGDPFEGDRELVLRRLPADARVVSARATLTPIDRSAGRDPFVEEIRFAEPTGAVGDWGATQVRAAGFAEIDFHARRTLAGLAGSDLAGAGLQVDLGGSFVGVDHRGGLASPPGSPLQLTNDGPLPGIAASRVRIASASGAPAVNVLRIRSLPTNVTLALAGRPALFFHAGELATARTTGDWGELLAGYLAEGATVVDGVYALPFVVHSDSIARLAVAIEVEYLRLAPLLPAGLPEAKLAYDLATRPRAGSVALAVALPVEAVPIAAANEGRIVGAFDETRIAWEPSREADAPAVGISPSRSAAQPLALPERAGGYDVVAVDLLLAAVDRRVRLVLDLRIDEGDKPGAASLLGSPVPFELTREKHGGETWVGVELPRALALRSPGELRSWLLLQGAEGEAAWSAGFATSAAVPLQASTDGGFSYRAAAVAGVPGPLVARFRLRERPPGFRMPLAVELRGGVDAVHVDLSYLSPLGKVDFELSIPELSAGISAALARVRAGGAAGGAGGELLVDPGFARWVVEGAELGEPRQFFPGDGQPSFVAFAGDGRNAYLVLTESGACHLAAWDTEIDALAWRLAFDPELRSALGLAVDPAGRLAYLLFGGGIAVVDLDARRLLGAPLALNDPGVPAVPVAIAASSDGTRIAVAESADATDLTPPSTRVAVYDIEALASLARAGAALAAEARIGEPVPAGGRPLAVAFSPDGALLHVLAETAIPPSAAECQLSTHAAETLAARPVQVSFDGLASTFAVSPDGGSLLVLHPERLDRYDARTLAPLSTLAFLGKALRALAVEPGGRRALLVGDGGFLAVGLATTRLQVEPWPPGIGSGVGVAVSPRGDRAVKIPGAFVIPIGARRPVEWTATAGRVQPSSLTGDAGRGVRLGDAGNVALAPAGSAPRPAPGPSALSQVVPAIPGRTYELSFHGQATAEARGEVLWRTAEGASVGREAIPFQLRKSAGPMMLPHRGRFRAPPAAIAAEVRFVTEEGLATVRDASFREPENALVNGDLLGIGDAATGAWRQEPAAAPGFLVSALVSASRARNGGAVPMALRQSVAVEPGASFELLVAAVLESGPPARVEVRFLAADGAALGATSRVELGARAFGSALAAGVVPAAAARAEVTLALPPGASLLVSAIDLRLGGRVRIPVELLAEAPGELSVLGGAIAWDLPEVASAATPRPRPMPGGAPLPAPTPPPGAEDGACGGHEDSPAPSVPALPPAPLPPTEPPLVVDLSVISGIGPKRSQILRARGITTLQALLVADPRELARAMPGVSERSAVGFIRQARERIRTG